MTKCFCGHIWTDKEILKGFEKDEGGKFYRCYLPYDKKNMSCSGLYYIGEEMANEIYKVLKKRHKEILLEKVQNNHKYTLDVFGNV